MTSIHCGYHGCINNENGQCHVAAIRLEPDDCCLTYQPLESRSGRLDSEQGDRLTWDREYFEDDPIDNENIM